MYLLYFIFVFIFGTIIGSFVKVVSLRYNTGLSIWFGRSKCFNCGKTLKTLELIPLFSYIFQGGKCKTCKSKISLEYFLVEVISGIIFVAIFARQIHYFPLYQTFSHGLLYSSLFFVYYAFVFSLLLVIALYDLRHKIIPNVMVYSFIALGVLKLAAFLFCKYYFFHSISTLDILDISAPFALFIPFALLWLVSDGKWMGFGDVKLIFGMGLLLGFVSGIGAAVLGFWLGALWSVYLLVYAYLNPKSRKVFMRTEIPFAPFLILATMIVFFSGIDVLHLGFLINSV